MVKEENIKIKMVKGEDVKYASPKFVQVLLEEGWEIDSFLLRVKLQKVPALQKFYIKEWKWVWGIGISIAGLILAYLKL